MEEKETYSINNLLIMVSIIYFTYISMIGSTEDSLILTRYGALYIPLILKNKEYYRLVTSIFMHAGILHLICNMINQYTLGERLELALGKVKFLIFYLLCGIGANIATMRFEIFMVTEKSSKYNISIGASGAICGIAGGLVYVAQRNKNDYNGISVKMLITTMIFWIACGFIMKNINNMAHISGFILGYVLAIVLYRKDKDLGGKIYDEVNNNEKEWDYDRE